MGFLVAAEATYERHAIQRDGPEHWPAIIVNLCFAIELSLKAFLASCGCDREHLIRLRHNLTRALREAVENGYRPGSDAVPALIEELSPYHKDHSIRYLEGRDLDLPDTSNMIAIVRLLVAEVGGKLQAGRPAK